MESEILEFGIQLKESEIPLTIGIRNISSIDKESGIQYMESKTVSITKALGDNRDQRSTTRLMLSLLTFEGASEVL